MGPLSPYRDLFQLETPFLPEENLIAGNIEENSWNDLPFACVESLGRSDICTRSARVKRLREIPPAITLNLSQIGLPAINIANLPQGIDPQSINALVQQVVQASVQPALNAAVQNAIVTLLRSLPQKGFETVYFNSGWKTER